MLQSNVCYVALLILSNIFMTFAWFYHLKDTNTSYFAAVLGSWGIAFIEYCILIPATRFGNQYLSLPQMKIIQEVVTMTVFVPFAIFVMKEKVSWNFLFAALCMIGAVYFIFKN